MATAESHVPGSGQGWGTWASVAARAALRRRRWKGTCLRAWAPSMAGMEVQGANLGSLGPCRTFPFAGGASPRHSALLLFASLSSMAVAIDSCCVRILAWGWRALPELWGQLVLSHPILSQPSSAVPRTQLFPVPGEQRCPCSSGSRLPPTRRREEMDAAVRSRAPANYPSECVL